MDRATAIEQMLNAAAYFDTQSAGYTSWGHVTVLQIACKTPDAQVLVTDADKTLERLTAQDIQPNRSGVFQQIFNKRKDIGVILITKQQYASQVKREIPPILDDQAQLLGVSVRVAASQDHILKALSGRFAAILPDGTSICLGSNIEEAYVAAQLLEKTSKAFVEAEWLGGAKPINRIEAWLMHKFYLFKYSKEAKKNK